MNFNKILSFFDRNNFTPEATIKWLLVTLLITIVALITHSLFDQFRIYLLNHLSAQALLIVLELLLLIILGALILAFFIFLNNKKLKKQIESLNQQIEKLQKKLPHIFSMNIIWDNHQNPYCPSDLTLMHPHPYEAGRNATELQCFKCKQIIPIFHNVQLRPIKLIDAKFYLINNKYPHIPEEVDE